MFRLKENGTNVTTEILAGITTFFAMAYIIVVNPSILSESGMEWGAVFLATIISAIVGTLVMGLFANVPYAQAPGMGLNAFFVFTVVFALKFTWQQALSMVFICGVINILITVTRVRKYIIKAIPRSLQNAIGGGIGVFIAYLGLLNGQIIDLSGAVPAIAVFNQPHLWVFLIGLFITFILLMLKVRGAILIGIILSTLIGIPFGVTNAGDSITFSEAASKLPTTFGVIFTAQGIPSLFNDMSKLPLVLITIFAFSLSDTFDTIGTFIGTGRRSGIFSEEDERLMETSSGFKSKMDKALFADAIATSVGAVVGTSNTTTYVESAAGIGVGGRTGLTSVVVAICFALSAFLAQFASAIPNAATGPALVVVGIMMLSTFSEIKWDDLSEAMPAFFAGIFMALCYSISYGIAAGFIVYCLVKVFKGEAREISPILWIATALFILNFVLMAVMPGMIPPTAPEVPAADVPVA
jgi:AGZA family xanthine/uracil permease-like MFS transporter